MTAGFDAAVAAVASAAPALVAALDPAGCADVARISPTQLRVLTWLRDNPSVNVNGLAESLEVGPSSASRMCDRLEALGLLRRVPEPGDRREVRLVLTGDARTLLDALSGHRQRVVARILAGMPEKSRRELARSLMAFAEAASVPSRETVAERRTA